MRSSSVKIIEVTLILGGIEAQWLMEMMQNPLHGRSVEDENQTDKTMRKIFWDALKKEGIEV